MSNLQLRGVSKHQFRASVQRRRVVIHNELCLHGSFILNNERAECASIGLFRPETNGSPSWPVRQVYLNSANLISLLMLSARVTGIWQPTRQRRFRSQPLSPRWAENTLYPPSFQLTRSRQEVQGTTMLGIPQDLGFTISDTNIWSSPVRQSALRHPRRHTTQDPTLEGQSTSLLEYSEETRKAYLRAPMRHDIILSVASRPPRAAHQNRQDIYYQTEPHHKPEA